MRADTEVPTSAPTGLGYVWLILVLGTIVALPPLAIDLYLPALPDLRDELGASDLMAQMTFTGMVFGTGLGQLVVGPLSDAWGRLRPLGVGIVLHAGSSLACAVAPTIETLIVARFVQGTAGAAISVAMMAGIRDRYAGVAMARVMSNIMLIVMMAPILAPTLGGQVLRFTDWRGVFVVLLVAAVIVGVVVLVFHGETLPPARRHPASWSTVVGSYAHLFRDRSFIALAAIGGLTAAAIFSYISSSSFVFQDGFGLSKGTFAAVYGLNALAFLVGAQLNPLLARRLSLVTIMTGGNAIGIIAGVVALTCGLTQTGGVAAALVPFGFVLFSIGLVLPNTPALALYRHGDRAGAAAALLGFLTMGSGAALSPVVAAIGTDDAVPLASVVIVLLVLAAVMLRVVARNAEIAAVGGHGRSEHPEPAGGVGI